MNPMKNKAAFTLFIAVVLGVMAAGATGHCRTIVKVASVMPEGSPWTQILREMAAEVDQKTAGQVSMKIYAGGVSGDEADVIRKMRVNRIHAAGFTGVGLGMIVPHIRILESPLLFQNLQEVDFVKEQLMEDFAADFAREGYVFLGYVDGGFVYFFSRTSLAEPDDLKKIKMWLWTNDRIAETFLDVFGIKAYPLHVADVNTGLETGMIDAFYSVPVAAVSFQWYWRIQYMLDYPIVNSTGGFLVNKRLFDGLTEKERGVLRETVKKHCDRLVKITRESNLEAQRVLAGAGIQLVKPSPAQMAHFRRKATETYERNIPSLYSRPLLEKIQGLVTSFRQKEAHGATE
ncbi:MAG: TRAP transporter substrate-binding protein DctP [Thermodesulfobacteriota bacterium]